jgi:hypothetical protein
MNGDTMDLSEIKAYLEKELLEFTYISGRDTPHEENWNSIRVIRDGHEIVLDVSKVATEKDLKQLKSFIELKWRSVEI